MARAEALRTPRLPRCQRSCTYKTWTGLACLAALGLLLLGAARALANRGARTLVHGLIVLGVLLALIGIIQKATFTGKIYGIWQPLYSGSSFGPFVNKNHFAGWMLMALPLALGDFCARVARGLRGVKPGWRHRVVWFSSPEAN